MRPRSFFEVGPRRRCQRRADDVSSVFVRYGEPWFDSRKVYGQESGVRGKQVVPIQVRQRDETHLSYLGRALCSPGVQAAPKCRKSVSRRTAKIKVEPVRSGFLGDVGDGIDAKQAHYRNFDTKLLHNLPAQRGFKHIVRRGVVAWPRGISGS